MNTYFSKQLLRQIAFWREKRLEKEIRTQFNMELYLKILEIKNS